MSRFRINGFSFSLGQFLFVLFVLLALFVRHLSRYGNTSQPTHHPPVWLLVGGDHTVLPPNPPLPWSSLHATPSLSQSRFLMNVPWNSPWSPAPVAPQWLHDAVSTGRQPGNAAGDAIINFFCQNSYLEATFFHWGYRDIFLKVSLLHSTLNSFYPIIDKGMSPSRSGLLDMSWQIARRPLLHHASRFWICQCSAPERQPHWSGWKQSPRCLRSTFLSSVLCTFFPLHADH